MCGYLTLLRYPTLQNQGIFFLVSTKSGVKTIEYFYCTCRITGITKVIMWPYIDIYKYSHTFCKSSLVVLIKNHYLFICNWDLLWHIIFPKLTAYQERSMYCLEFLSITGWEGTILDTTNDVISLVKGYTILWLVASEIEIVKSVAFFPTNTETIILVL